jgi:peptidoglycan/LPS O-acetylase OafA/YrhL
LKPLSHSLLSRQNNYNLVRLAAAVSVVFFHAYQMNTKVGNIADPLTRALSQWGLGLGELAVGVFFFLSGMLVSLSWVRDPRLGPFLMRRAARLLPGLVVCLVVTATLAVTFFSDQGIRGLLTGDLWHYVVHNALLHELKDTIPRDEYIIPGVFGRFNPSDVNGPLWTLFWEAKAYLLLAVIGWAAMLPARIWLGLCSVLLIALTLTVPSVFAGFFWEHRLLMLFFSGVVVATLLANSVTPRWEAVLAALLLVHFSKGPAVLAVFIAACLAALLVGSREAVASRHVAKHDYSYGIYIYHWPVMQMIRGAVGEIGAWEIFFIALGMTMAFAAFSWHFVERPALSWTAAWIKRRDAGIRRDAQAVPGTK